VTSKSSSEWIRLSTSSRASHSSDGSEQDTRHGDRISAQEAPPPLLPKEQSTILPIPGLPELGESKAQGSPTSGPLKGGYHPQSASGSSASSRLNLKNLRPPIQQLVEKRMNTLGIRLRVRERRNALRKNRETLSDRDAQFSQNLRSIVAKSNDSELKALLSQYEDNQDYREDVQLKESEYNVLEDELNRSEWDMKEVETKVYHQLRRAHHQFHVDAVSSFSGGDLDYVASSSSTASAPSMVSPMRQKWLSRIGDRNLLMEQLQELRAERADWVEEERVRQEVGLGLPEEGQLFLANFNTRHRFLQGDLVQVEADVSRLQEGLLDQADVLYSSSQFDDQIHPTDFNQSPMEPKLEMVDIADPDLATEDPLFLRDDELKPHAVFSDVALDSKKESISTVSYINTWLLHILRRSAIEILRFKTTETLRALQLDREQLTRLVLEWWSNDATVNLFPMARNSSARSVSITSKAKDGIPTNRATRSDSVLFSVARVAHRLQGSQSIRLDGAPNMTLSRLPKILHHPYHKTASSP
jgi:hypothetical protein